MALKQSNLELLLPLFTSDFFYIYITFGKDCLIKQDGWFYFCSRLFQQLEVSRGPLAASETHIVNGRLYGTAELSSQSIFILLAASQDQLCGI